MDLGVELCNMDNFTFTMFTKTTILEIMSLYLFERRIELKRNKKYSSIKRKDVVRIIETTMSKDRCVEHLASRRKTNFRHLGDNYHVNMQVDNYFYQTMIDPINRRRKEVCTTRHEIKCKCDRSSWDYLFRCL